MELKVDCVRLILLWLEKNLKDGDQVGSGVVAKAILDETLSPDFNIDDLVYAIKQMHESGLINATPAMNISKNKAFFIFGITTKGHSLLADIKNQND